MSCIASIGRHPHSLFLASVVLVVPKIYHLFYKHSIICSSLIFKAIRARSQTSLWLWSQTNRKRHRNSKAHDFSLQTSKAIRALKNKFIWRHWASGVQLSRHDIRQHLTWDLLWVYLRVCMSVILKPSPNVSVFVRCVRMGPIYGSNVVSFLISHPISGHSCTVICSPRLAIVC